jgi:NADH-quinone oxidoreductase subunit D
VSDGSERPVRVRIRAPSFSNLSVLPRLVQGWKLSDVVTILSSLGVAVGEMDR